MSSPKAYARDFVRAVEREGMSVLGQRKIKGHLQFDVRLKNGENVDVRMSGTPACTHHAIDNQVKILRRYEKGILSSKASQHPS